MGAHESAKPTGLDDRTSEQLTFNDIERITS
jgi:hypothetical protein